MSVYRRYFRISGGELLKRAQEIEEEHNKARLLHHRALAGCRSGGWLMVSDDARYVKEL